MFDSRLWPFVFHRGIFHFSSKILRLRSCSSRRKGSNITLHDLARSWQDSHDARRWEFNPEHFQTDSVLGSCSPPFGVFDTVAVATEIVHMLQINLPDVKNLSLIDVCGNSHCWQFESSTSQWAPDLETCNPTDFYFRLCSIQLSPEDLELAERTYEQLAPQDSSKLELKTRVSNNGYSLTFQGANLFWAEPAAVALLLSLSSDYPGKRLSKSIC